MLENFFQSSSVPLLEQVAKFAERRQAVLAGNVANFDTPGYQRLDLPANDFHEALRLAIADQHRGNSPQSLLPSQHGLSWPESIQERLPARAARFDSSLFQARPAASGNVNFRDQNNRSVEQEMMELQKNSMLHGFAVEMMRAQMGTLQAAISERPFG